jgi:hypothetical protein
MMMSWMATRWRGALDEYMIGGTLAPGDDANDGKLHEAIIEELDAVVPAKLKKMLVDTVNAPDYESRMSDEAQFQVRSPVSSSFVVTS